MPIRSVTARRLAIFGVSALCLAVCCGLAWWQWERFSSAGGSFQNLGYVLQWPLFGLFPAFVFWRIRRLNSRAGSQDRTGQASLPDPPGKSPVAGVGPRRVPGRQYPTSGPAPGERTDPEDPEDAELAAYNRYLAELYARDQRDAQTTKKR